MLVFYAKMKNGFFIYNSHLFKEKFKKCLFSCKKIEKNISFEQI